MSDPLHHYREVWLVDFEFRAPDGERPEPVCMVARERRTGRTIPNLFSTAGPASGSSDRIRVTGRPVAPAADPTEPGGNHLRPPAGRVAPKKGR